jgi:GxxExxY protein
MNPAHNASLAPQRAQALAHEISPDMRAVSQQRDPQTYAVIGAAMAVHKELGGGFLERVYQEALVLELGDRGIPYGCEVEVNVHYKGRALTCSYRADLICFADDNPVLIELKACERLTHAHRAQVIHYMKATRIPRALLMNFGGPVLQFERMVLGWDR